MADSTASLGGSSAGSTYFDAQSMANTSESLRDASIPPALPEDAQFGEEEPPDLMVRGAACADRPTFGQGSPDGLPSHPRRTARTTSS